MNGTQTSNSTGYTITDRSLRLTTEPDPHYVCPLCERTLTAAEVFTLHERPRRPVYFCAHCFLDFVRRHVPPAVLEGSLEHQLLLPLNEEMEQAA